MSLRTFRLFLLLVAFCEVVWAIPQVDARISGFLAGGGSSGPSPSQPVVTSIVPTPASGTYTSGSISFAVNFSVPITATGTITLPLNTTPTQGVATCVAAANVTTLTCAWSIGTNQSANPLGTTSSGLVVSGGTIVATTGGVIANLTPSQNYAFSGLIINPTGTPSVVTGVSISSTGLFTTSGSVGAGNTATVTVTFSQPQTVQIAGGTPTVTLATGTVCPWVGGSGTANITFGCTFTSGQNTPLNTWQTWLTMATSNAVQLNGGSITNGALPATLSGANSLVFKNVQVDTTSPIYFTAPSGSGSTCSYASPCLPAAAQTKARASMGHIWLKGGTYSGLATCTMQPNNGGTQQANLCLTTADNNEVWSGMPAQTAILNGGSTNSGNGTFTAFSIGANGSTAQISGLTILGITFTAYNGAWIYAWEPTNLLIANTIATGLFNDGNNGGCGGDCPSTWNGAGGAIAIYSLWQNVQILHNTISNSTGNGVTFTGGTSSLNGFSMTKTVDSNLITNTTTVNNDAGAIYTGWDPYAVGHNLAATVGQITNNFILNVGPSSLANGTVCIYHDIYSSGNTVTGNVCTGQFTWFIELDTGSNDILSNNIIDITAVSNGSNTSNNATIYFFTYFSPSSSCGSNTPPTSCPYSVNVTSSKNIVYNGSTTHGPPAYMGLYYSGALQIPPAFSSNWYATAHGSFVANYQWGGGTLGSGSSVTDPTGTLVNASTLFANPSAQTPAGFQLQAGSAPLAGGFQQIATNQGPQS